MWAGLKFGVRHVNDIERLAMIGEKRRQQGMAAFRKPFTTAEVRHFTHDEAEQARAWVAEGLD